MSNYSQFRLLQLQCLRSVLRPIVRFCLKRGHSIQDLVRLIKILFLELAEEELKKVSKKINPSRLSAMTGLYRQEISSLRQANLELGSSEPLSIVGRVIGQWEQDKRFCSAAGQPKTLTYKGDKSEFQALVHSISQQINPGTILFELERAGAVKRTPRGVKLVTQVYRLDKDPRAGFELLGLGVERFVSGVSENILNRQAVPNLHIHTEYDNIAPEDIPHIRCWLLETGAEFHRRAREFLAQYDRDLKPELMSDPGAPRARVTVTAFSQSEEIVSLEAKDKLD